MVKSKESPMTIRSHAVSNISNVHMQSIVNPHQVTKSQVGLWNVDNTSDADKPISSETLTALSSKVDKNGYTGSIAVVTAVDFIAKTVTTCTISYVNGQIINVV